MTSILKLDHIQVIYDQSILAVKDVSLSVQQGEIVALLGANGAGKSTTLKAISQLISSENGEVKSGNIYFEGQSILHQNPSDIVRQGIVQVLEGRHCFKQLTVEENLRAGAFLRKPSGQRLKQSLEKVYEYFPRLAEKRSTQAGYTSGGEQQMLAIGRALMTEPKLILLDEPSMGLAPSITQEIFKLIRYLQHKEQLSFLIAEQNIGLALEYTHQAYVIENGVVTLSGNTQNLYQSGDIQRAYIGQAV
ncbi:ABC transporter ATP-binding protein [Acinetobacter baylyi]|uniref:ABC transporter ATP-binding protein n=1 Tax=Acinetobacter baylyi TaxID=202950 RepID=UPI0031CEFF6D